MVVEARLEVDAEELFEFSGDVVQLLLAQPREGAHLHAGPAGCNARAWSEQVHFFVYGGYLW